MTNDAPQDQQPQLHHHHHHQQEHQQDFKQKLEALYSQSKSWFDRQKQDLENLEAHQHDINQINLESIANVKANLQLTRSDVAFLRTNIRTLDEHIDDLRMLVDKNKQLSTIQIETVAQLKLERASLLAYQKTLHQRAEKLEADLAAMTLRIEALGRQLSRLKREVREHKEAPGHSTATTVAEEDRRAQEIQRILSTIHGYEAVHAYALERIPPPPPSSDLSQKPFQAQDQYRENSNLAAATSAPFDCRHYIDNSSGNNNSIRKHA
ncbi:hypothetical protein KI688_004771 [Linnemannia hyalina]|uniref:Uncharacterized protein n=1 Tax=Linnemannia hyalina TaxID=64524 RepID=A0A9P7XKX1_9FUNG|nr:hypothetical protein KI688_004771 [Linnemannia hyalina]